MKHDADTRPNTETGEKQAQPSRCAFDALLWVVVVLLMLLFGVFVVLGAVWSLRGVPAPVFGAAIAAGVFCALLLAMLLLSYFALSMIRFCCEFCRRNGEDSGPSKYDLPCKE